MRRDGLGAACHNGIQGSIVMGSVADKGLGGRRGINISAARFVRGAVAVRAMQDKEASYPAANGHEGGDPMPTGKVKWFDPKKGYGFIIGDDGQDVFVHYTSIIGEGFRALKDGDMVDYELVKSDKGFQARNVARPDTIGGQSPTA
jgi:CspA family cold shock protein